MKNFAIAFSLLCSVSFTVIPTGELAALPAQVIIIRHGEKDSEGNLSKKGLERAGALAAYFAYTDYLTLYGTPVAIFAARPTPNAPPYRHDENTQRCIQTVGPTALNFRLPIHSGYDSLQQEKIAAFVLNNPVYDGKTVLICWHHESMDTLAQAFGIDNPPPYPGSQFDITWVITYSPTPALATYLQKLLFDDTP